MTGVKGAGGPPPKRKDQTRHRGQKASGDPETAPGAEVVVIPDGDPDWHPLALRWFDSLRDSGQSAFYEPSDWMLAQLLAESISRELKPQPVVNKETGYVTWISKPVMAATLSSFLKGNTALMASEGERRRHALELERAAPEEDASVEHLDDVRLRLAGRAG